MFHSSGYSIFEYVTLSRYFLLNYLDFNLILTSFVYTFKLFQECFSRSLNYKNSSVFFIICNALRDLVSFVQFTIHEKHP